MYSKKLSESTFGSLKFELTLKQCLKVYSTSSYVIQRRSENYHFFYSKLVLILTYSLTLSVTYFETDTFRWIIKNLS